MKLIVFGASGKVGRLVVEEALRRGHTVTAFVHTQELPAQEHLTNFKGDIYDRSNVEDALQNYDAIISALGSWGTENKNILSTAMQMIVPAAETQGIQRLVSLTGDAALAPGDPSRIKAKVMRVATNVIAPRILRDGEDHISILAGSSLMWTVLRSPVMTNRDTVAYELSLRGASFTISRHAVAKALVDLVETNEWPKAAPFIRRS